jgi:hypothetical protein
MGFRPREVPRDVLCGKDQPIAKINAVTIGAEFD